jgi:hypothetical protein
MFINLEILNNNIRWSDGLITDLPTRYCGGCEKRDGC